MRRQIALDWAADWMEDHQDTVRRLDRSIDNAPRAEIGRWTGQLKTLHEKRFTGLLRVIEALADEDAI